MRSIINPFRFPLMWIIAILLVFSCTSSSATKSPRLFIIITVDQLRADHLWRYDKAFTGCFRRLRDEGWRYDKGIVDHAPTLSWPGHTTVATGAHPKTHGISSNAYIVDNVKRRLMLYDTEAQILGYPHALSLSSKKIRVTGMADWFRAADSEARTVALSTGPGLALCYGGRPHPERTKNHVYWLESSAGQFVTTTFYRDEYPEWIEKFNKEVLPDYKKSLVWENSVPEELRNLARMDDAAYEGDGIHTTFPHKIEHKYRVVNETTINSWFYDYSPHANEALFALAKEAVKKLELGQRNAKDFLAIAIKSTDRIGHDYGPLSLEQMDNILRIDRELGKFLTFLDETIGRKNYIVALTSDHGAPNVVEYEITQGRKAKRVSEGEIRDLLSHIEEFIDNYTGSEDKLPVLITQELEKSDFVVRAMTPEELAGSGPADHILHSYRNSYVPENKTTFPLWTYKILSGVVSPKHPGNFGVIVEFIENGQLFTARSAHASSHWFDQEVPAMIFESLTLLFWV